ncbi:MAG TPA: flippase [Terriglobia bacterium]|nr:flippase [Terriglobia bacterium]
MSDPLEIRSGLVVRNAALNLGGHVIPLVIGLVTIPYVVRGLGSAGFGILSIAWVLLGYLGLFDLGLGRATTKFVAECLGRGEIARLPSLVWTSLGYQLAFSVPGILLVEALVPFLAGELKVPPALASETRLSFYILAPSLPIILASTALRSVLEAAQRFDLVNYIKVPANVSVFILPAIAIALGLHLPGIIFLLVLGRLGAMLAYLVTCLKVFPILGQSFPFDPKLLSPLMTYGGWVTVSMIVSAVLVYGDRLVVGAMVSMAAVGYYAAPAEIINRLSIFPGSLVLTLFPALSSLDAWGAKDRVEKLYGRSLKFLLLCMGPILVLIVVFAGEILRLWLGSDFASKSTLVLQILAVGVLLNSMACIPFTLIHALGRPDVTAKFHLLELPIYAGVLWILVERLGITGAALAWTFRMGFDAALVFGAAWRLKLASVQTLAQMGLLKSTIAVLTFGLVSFLALWAGWAWPIQVVFSAVLLPLFALGTWSFVLDKLDRSFLTGAAGRILVTFRGA